MTDVPNMVLLDEKTYASTYSELLTGKLCMTCNNGAYVCLKNAFTNLFSADLVKSTVSLQTALFSIFHHEKFQHLVYAPSTPSPRQIL